MFFFLKTNINWSFQCWIFIFIFPLLLETQIFVEKLFDAVNTKSYLPPPEQPSSGSLKVEFFQHQEKETKKEEVSTEFILNVCLSLFSQFTYVVQFHHVYLFINSSPRSWMTALKCQKVFLFNVGYCCTVFCNIIS